jgi:uncharacterized protein YbgA (DUF1722 family)/uncharacterized protein YbbK (DUF523 family)
MPLSQPLVGIGACLVGQPVRYNGDSKRRNPHIDALASHVRLRPFCPELAIGMGVPRKPVRLVGEPGDVALVDSDSQSRDYTLPMQDCARQWLSEHAAMAGYILVKGSPSCGYQRVKRYNAAGSSVGADAVGIFAAQLLQLNPLLPVEEDGRLHDHSLRENFICRVFVYHHWLQLLAGGLSHHRLLGFWARHKYLAMAHHVPSYRQIGRLLAEAKSKPLDSTAEAFIALLMQALAMVASRKSHTNVLQHIRGYLKRDLQAQDQQELDRLIEQYRTGIVPLVVPLTLLRHHFKRHRNAYIEQQVFMLPYPEQLSLRNAI